MLENCGVRPAGPRDYPRVIWRRALAAERGVSNVRVFWSVARGDERCDSDVDLVVEVAPGTGLFALEALRRDLTQLLGVDVDIALYKSRRSRVRDEVERDAVAL